MFRSLLKIIFISTLLAFVGFNSYASSIEQCSTDQNPASATHHEKNANTHEKEAHCFMVCQKIINSSCAQEITNLLSLPVVLKISFTHQLTFYPSMYFSIEKPPSTQLI